jgi:hypothetical protein
MPPPAAPSLEEGGQAPDMMARVAALPPEAKDSLLMDFFQSLTTDEAEAALADAESMSGEMQNVTEPVQPV